MTLNDGSTFSSPSLSPLVTFNVLKYALCCWFDDVPILLVAGGFVLRFYLVRTTTTERRSIYSHVVWSPLPLIGSSIMCHGLDYLPCIHWHHCGLSVCLQKHRGRASRDLLLLIFIGIHTDFHDRCFEALLLRGLRVVALARQIRSWCQFIVDQSPDRHGMFSEW